MTQTTIPRWHAVAGLVAVNLLAIAYVRAMAGSSFAGLVPWGVFTAFEVLAYVSWRWVRRRGESLRQFQ